MTAAWTESSANTSVTARWYPADGNVCTAACAAWPNSCVAGCLVCSSSATAIGLVGTRCALQAPAGSLVSVSGAARTRTDVLSGPEFKTCYNVSVLSLAPAAPPAPPPSAGEWDGTQRLSGGAVSMSWKVCANNATITLLFSGLAASSAYPILAVAKGTGMAKNTISGEAFATAYVGWLDGAGVGRVVSYRLDSKHAANVRPTGEVLSDTAVWLGADGRCSFRFNRPLASTGSPAAGAMAAEPTPFVWALFTRWASADSVALPLESDEHAVRSRSHTLVDLGGGSVPDASAPSSALPRAVVAHAVCMALAWGVCFPGGALAARFLKPAGGALFFKLHLAANAVGFVLLLAGFGIVYTLVQTGGGAHFDNRHAKGGLAVFVLFWAQPVNGALRPHPPPAGQPPERKRRAWELLHKNFGRGLMALSLVVAFAGIDEAGDDGAAGAAVAGGQAAWVLWCVGVAGAAVALERRQRRQGGGGRVAPAGGADSEAFVQLTESA